MHVLSWDDHMANTNVFADRVGVFWNDPSMDAFRMCIRQADRQERYKQMNNSVCVWHCERSMKELFSSIHPSSSSRQPTRLSSSLTRTYSYSHLTCTRQSHACDGSTAHPHSCSLAVSFSWTRLVDIFIGTRSNLCKVACSQCAGLEHVKSKQRENGNKLLFKLLRQEMLFFLY